MRVLESEERSDELAKVSVGVNRNAVRYCTALHSPAAQDYSFSFFLSFYLPPPSPLPYLSRAQKPKDRPPSSANEYEAEQSHVTEYEEGVYGREGADRAGH